MQLPMLATPDHVVEVTEYLGTKDTGVNITAAKATIGKSFWIRVA